MSKAGPSIPNQFRKTRLKMPIFGLASMIQETVKRIPGITSGITDMAKKSGFSGVLVRSLTHAKKVPTRREKTAVPLANFRELRRSGMDSALVYAVRKFSSV